MGLEIFLAALIGSAVAGIWDLKTTEVPDDLPVIMIVVGIGFWFLNAIGTGNAYPLLVSLSVGSILLAAGLLLYKKGQWGGADAWVLAAIGYMMPIVNGRLFIIDYIINFFIVSAIYMLIYSILLGVANPKVFSYFSADVRKNKKIFLIPLFFFVFLIAVHYYTFIYGAFINPIQSLLLFLLVLSLVLFWRYGKVIEKKLFRRRIHTAKLKEGDVLVDTNWIGLTRSEIARLRRQKRYVTIKEGIRFVPVFSIALFITYVYGNIIFLLV